MNAETDKEDDSFDFSRCVPPARSGHRQVLLIGDSHAAQYYRALHKAFPTVQIAQVTATGCRPLLKTEGAERCMHLMDMAFTELVNRKHFAAIILAARWKGRELGKLVRTIDYLKPTTDRIYVLGPVVEYDRPLPRLLALAKLDGNRGHDIIRASRELSRAERLDRRMSAAIGQLGQEVRYLSVLRTICTGSSCVTTVRPGVPTQFDYGHLTYGGAAYIIRQLRLNAGLSLVPDPRPILRNPRQSRERSHLDAA